MLLPVQNFVSEIDLKPNDVWLPLFESVVNSIISLMQTEGVDKSKKKIQIIVYRGDEPSGSGLFGQSNSVDSLVIIDNGKGFDERNFRSYQTAYSRENKNFGCKGIGRFTMLAGFKSISISSIYRNESQLFLREFTFDPINEVKEIKHEKTTEDGLKTTVRLNSFLNPNLREFTSLSLDEIAEKLMDHCLIYYLSGVLPRIEMFESDKKEIVVVNEKYANLSKEREKEFVVGDLGFRCFITKSVKRGNRKNHYVHYCANSRVVGDGRNLARVNSIFSYPIQIKSDLYFLNVYVVSEYLDSNVYGARNGFSIPDHKSGNLFYGEGQISFEDIEQVLSDILIEEYDSYVREQQKKNKEKVRDYIKKAPRFQRFLNREDILNQIPPNLSEEKLEDFLHKVSYREKKQIDESINEIIDKKDINEETIQRIKQDLKAKTAYDADNLSDYMTRRKAILDIFEKFLEADSTGTYKLEEDIHNLIFPLGVTSNESNFESHNLWILDERFTAYHFVASDKSITSFSQKKSRKEPDLLMVNQQTLVENPQMFDNPISYAPSSSGEVSSMVVFEFKRPGETAHQKRKNDFRWEFSELVEKYFDEFLYGTDKKNYKGRQVIVRKNTPKFGYVVVDVIPPKLEEYNIDRGYRKTPFGTLYKIISNLNMHIEVITFKQLIDGAKSRHAPFFDRLFESV